MQREHTVLAWNITAPMVITISILRVRRILGIILVVAADRIGTLRPKEEEDGRES
jgi:hypothetical protein